MAEETKKAERLPFDKGGQIAKTVLRHEPEVWLERSQSLGHRQSSYLDFIWDHLRRALPWCLLVNECSMDSSHSQRVRLPLPVNINIRPAPLSSALRSRAYLSFKNHLLDSLTWGKLHTHTQKNHTIDTALCFVFYLIYVRCLVYWLIWNSLIVFHRIYVPQF